MSTGALWTPSVPSMRARDRTSSTGPPAMPAPWSRSRAASSATCCWTGSSSPVISAARCGRCWSSPARGEGCGEKGLGAAGHSGAEQGAGARQAPADGGLPPDRRRPGYRQVRARPAPNLTTPPPQGRPGLRLSRLQQAAAGGEPRAGWWGGERTSLEDMVQRHAQADVVAILPGQERGSLCHRLGGGEGRNHVGSKGHRTTGDSLRRHRRGSGHATGVLSRTGGNGAREPLCRSGSESANYRGQQQSA